MTFRIYNVASGASPALWAETQSVSTVNGLFTTFLGSVTALPSSVFSGPNRWLGIAVSPDPEMTPRTAIVAVAYAYRIATLDGATGGSVSGEVTLSDGNLNLDLSTATSGSILKGGSRFIHNYGTGNTFVGLDAGNFTMTGSSNTASGSNALLNNTTGISSTASGWSALRDNTSGGGNTAFGFSALLANTTGNGNTAIGSAADVASGALTNATAIGANAVVNASNKIRLGDAAVTVIEGQVAYTFTSDKNQKENFHPVDGAEVLKKIVDLDLTSWNYKGQDPQQFRHYGPMAQEFFEAFGDDGIGASGTPTTINSGDQAGILMIAVQELSKDNDELRAQITELREMIRLQANQQK